MRRIRVWQYTMFIITMTLQIYLAINTFKEGNLLGTSLCISIFFAIFGLYLGVIFTKNNER